jgi:ribosomal protein S18 acetylase RimI-like enzyme
MHRSRGVTNIGGVILLASHIRARQSTAGSQKMRRARAERRILSGMSDHDPTLNDPPATRWSDADDGTALAAVHQDAWRYTYAGIIPGVPLERMIARRGPAWWVRMHRRGFRAMVIDCGGTLAGYATLGRSRAPGRPGGEIYELYVRPEYQGCGLGRRLFADARGELRRRAFGPLTVWALADNRIAVRFYRAMGGTEAALAEDRFCGVPLPKIGFAWG